MIVSAYAQAAAPSVLQLWIGLFDVQQIPPLSFRINGVAHAPNAAPVIAEIHDGASEAGSGSRNYRCVAQFAVPQAAHTCTVEIQAGAVRHTLVTRTLPEAIPSALDGSFNVLLCSCYSQPQDRDGLVSNIVSQIALQPHLTLLAGDQVYMDLPLLENLPENERGMSKVLGEKYRRNWGTAASLGVPGLEGVLRRAPVVCIPDDHEYWNNYPFKQKHLQNTWEKPVRERWARVARNLFEDYQGCSAPGDPSPIGARRIDVAPLKMLFIDMRSYREPDLKGTLMHAESLAELQKWEADLLAARNQNEPAVGVLASGQVLLREAAGKGKAETIDAEIADYERASELFQVLMRLADHGVPVLYLTGDVHFGRVVKGVDASSGRALLYEVISSPSRLIRVPFVDAGKEILGGVRGIFGKREPWPRHSDPADPPTRVGGSNRWTLSREHGQRGDQVAIISFTRSGSGVDFQVSYYGVHTDHELSKSRQTSKFSLNVG